MIVDECWSRVARKHGGVCGSMSYTLSTWIINSFIQSNNHKITLVVWTVTTSDKD